MSKTELREKLTRLVEQRGQIPDEFWVRTPADKFRAIWFVDRQKPSVEACYSFDEERFGLTIDGSLIWGFDSGCSCPSPWSANDFGDAYDVKEWREFEVDLNFGLDEGWIGESIQTIDEYLRLIDGVNGTLAPEDVLTIRNAEIRRFLIKRVGYERIKTAVGAKVLHTDGTSELLEFKDGDRYVKVKDSSTDREYLLYVPNNISRCREGIAWTFGLREEEYNPIQET